MLASRCIPSAALLNAQPVGLRASARLSEPGWRRCNGPTQALSRPAAALGRWAGGGFKTGERKDGTWGTHRVGCEQPLRSECMGGCDTFDVSNTLLYAHSSHKRGARINPAMDWLSRL